MDVERECKVLGQDLDVLRAKVNQARLRHDQAIERLGALVQKLADRVVRLETDAPDRRVEAENIVKEGKKSK